MQFRNFIIIKCIFLIGVSLSSRSPASESLHLNLPELASNQPTLKKYFLAYLDKIAELAQIEITVSHLPGKRAEVAIQQGAIDGFVLRSEAIENKLPHLVKSQKPYTFLNIAIISLEPFNDRQVMDEVKVSQSIAYPTNCLICMKFCSRFSQVHDVSSEEQVLGMVKKGRTTYGLVSQAYLIEASIVKRPAGNHLFKQTAFSTPLHTYVLPSKRKLLEKFDVAHKLIIDKKLDRKIAKEVGLLHYHNQMFLEENLF